MKARLKVEIGRVTFESRSRCPGPGRTYPTLQPPANNNLQINHMTTQFLQSPAQNGPLVPPDKKTNDMFQFPQKKKKDVGLNPSQNRKRMLKLAATLLLYLSRG